LAAGLGLIFGSFATAVAYRVPRKESLGGRSRCPECGAMISAAENIPLFSYLALRGRCRQCGARIHWRYPLIELFSAILFVAAVLRFDPTFRAVVYAALFWVLLVLTAVDLEHKLLPNRIIYPAFVAGWVFLTALALVEGTPRALIDAAIGALIFGGFFFLVAFIYPAGMGMGDTKFGFVLGTFLGYLGGFGLVLLGMFVSFLVGGIVGIAVMVITGGGRKMQIPFGPFMAVGTIVTIFCGEGLLDLYLGSF
jgi:leader peptidase (prepilin peptidase) / N-methyltransferase